MKRASLLILVLLLAACGSTTLGDLGSIFGSASPTNPSSVNGIVTGIDASQQRIDLNASSVNNLRPSSSQTTGAVYYDSSTRVVYNGNNYNVSDLERGDEVSVTGVNNNGRYLAQTINVVRNVRG